MITAKLAELFGLDEDQRSQLERLHRKACVDTRHTVIPLEEIGTLRGIEASNERYIAEATALGERALRTALDAAGRTPRDVDLLIVTSVTGVVVPSLDARLIPRLGLRPDVKRLPVFGLGCVAGAAGLARLHDYLLAWPHHTAALLSIELCSLTIPASDFTMAEVVASSLFGDGAAAVVGTGETPPPQAVLPPASGDGRYPKVIATRSEVYPSSGDALGWRLGADSFRIVLLPELGDIVERHIGGTVTSFLAEHDLTVDDITTWMVHPGGPKVIDAVRNGLKLPESAVEPSRRALAEAGNLSSVSVLHILQNTVADGVPPGSFGMMIGLGPGVSAELILLRW
jgi:alkylresorcinol/alkylpyrone synthase